MTASWPLPVVNRDKRLVDIIVLGDIARLEAGDAQPLRLIPQPSWPDDPASGPFTSSAASFRILGLGLLFRLFCAPLFRLSLQHQFVIADYLPGDLLGSTLCLLLQSRHLRLHLEKGQRKRTAYVSIRREVDNGEVDRRAAPRSRRAFLMRFGTPPLPAG
jgi:hypothetical protein